MPYDVDYEAFLSQSRDMFCVAGTDGLFKWLNPRWTEVLGWSEESLLATPFLEFVHPEDVKGTLDEVAKLADGVPTLNFANRYRCVDGNYRWLEWVAHPCPDGTLYSCARDVTARMERVASLKERHASMQLAEQFAAVGHWRVDVRTGEVYWSPEVYRIHGLDPATHTPTVESGVNAYHPEDRERVETLVNRAVEAGEDFEFQLRLVRPDGEIRWVDSAGRCNVNEHGELISLFGVFRDVTERFEELRRRNDELDRFTYAIAHDIRAPLRTVSGLSRVLELKLGEEASPDVQEVLAVLRGQVKSMAELVDELYRFVKVTGIKGDWKHLPLSSLVDEAVTALDAAVSASEAVVTVTGEASVHGLPGQLRLLFQNLIDNAIKYSKPGLSPQVSVHIEQRGALAVVTCVDQGVGFDSTNTSNLFRPFGRLVGAESNVEGIGMGLALCKRIVDAHGGSLRADSAPGEGATFTVELPSA